MVAELPVEVRVEFGADTRSLERTLRLTRVELLLIAAVSKLVQEHTASETERGKLIRKIEDHEGPGNAEVCGWIERTHVLRDRRQELDTAIAEIQEASRRVHELCAG